MDLKQQLGNLFIIGFPGTQLQPGCPIERDITEKNLGGVILFDRCLHDPAQSGNISSPPQLRELTTSLQALSTTELLVCVDQEGGPVQRLHPENGFPSTPSAATLGTVDGRTENTQAEAEQTAHTLAAAGINVNFAPVVDLNRNPGNPIIGHIGRSFSDSPEQVIDHASAWVDAHRKYGITTCLKHFPGHGSSRNDSHLGFVDITTSWSDEELIPYRELISTGAADMIMTGHLFNRNIDPDFPATLSRPTISSLLRQDLCYDGIIVTDDMQMKAISESYQLSEALCRAIAAGVDIIVIGNNLVYDPGVLEHGIEALWDGLNRGMISEERLFSALNKVNEMKFNMKEKTYERTNHA